MAGSALPADPVPRDDARVLAAFSQTYAEARAQFLAAAEAAHLSAQPHVHPLLGRDGETLAMDVVRDGDAAATSQLLITSGCHGVEGFCGSAIQTVLLRDSLWRTAARAAGVAVLYVHALNPWGFSWARRTTQENVDLNRNFHDFRQPLPHNEAYDRIAHLLVPAQWPPSAEVEQALHHYATEHGQAALQTAITSGQYSHPQGLFYGGTNPTWSHITLCQVLREHGRRCKRMAWIDLHTGLGPSGHGERIFDGHHEPVALARARAWWGPGVTSVDEGSSSSAPLTGQMWQAAREECPQAEHTGITLEYGTLPLPAMLDALRADQWLENHPERASGATHDVIKRQLRGAFYTDTDAWKLRVVEQAVEAAHQAVKGLTR